MGSGKSTVGKKLADLLDYQFIDLDEYIGKMAGMTVSSIFSSKGEKAFRELEREALVQIDRLAEAVIATGGGAPCFSDNMEFMNQSGKTIYLRMPVITLVERLQHEKEDRPLIRGKNDEELDRYVRNKLEEREAYYRKAQIIIDGDPLDLDRLLTHLQ
jgi:shikimate kinase